MTSFNVTTVIFISAECANTFFIIYCFINIILHFVYYFYYTFYHACFLSQFFVLIQPALIFFLTFILFIIVVFIAQPQHTFLLRSLLRGRHFIA